MQASYKPKVLCKIYLHMGIILLVLSFNVLALDTVKLLRPKWDITNHHAEFKDVLIQKIMDITQTEYGPYKLVTNPLVMNRSRALSNIIKGETHNLYITPSQQEWDEKAIAIKIPIRLGLLSYRLLLIHKDDIALFSEINTLTELKKLTAGLRSKWLTTEIFKQQGFTMIESENYDRLFFLLNKHKFHYFPRSIYEVYGELAERKDLYENMMIEPRLALYIPTATYIYVSPKEPRLAKRIEKGLMQLFENGELNQIIDDHYGDSIKQAQLNTRKIITIDNPYYLEADRANDQKYLYQP